MQDYIAAMPGWKRDVGERLDALIVRTVPEVHKAVKWNQPFYGLEGDGWFLAFRCYTKYVQLQFFRGTSLDPVPPKASKHAEVRYLDIHEDDELDENAARVLDQAGQQAARREDVNPYKTLRSVVRFEPIETDPVERRLARAASVADLRRIAKRRLPGGVFDYIDGGAEDERTLAANEAAFAADHLPAPRAARASRRSTSARRSSGSRSPTRSCSRRPASPASPIPTGELAVARAAARAGLPVHALDAQHPLDRGGPRRQRRAPLVPGVRLARPRAGARR